MNDVKKAFIEDLVGMVIKELDYVDDEDQKKKLREVISLVLEKLEKIGFLNPPW